SSLSSPALTSFAIALCYRSSSQRLPFSSHTISPLVVIAIVSLSRPRHLLSSLLLSPPSLSSIVVASFVLHSRQIWNDDHVYFLFARKFTPNALDRLLRFAPRFFSLIISALEEINTPLDFFLLLLFFWVPDF
ncbi:hypothetical protein U1Q18_019450, partial [Sarracenia purpurea var. burkii]